MMPDLPNVDFERDVYQFIVNNISLVFIHFVLNLNLHSEISYYFYTVT